VRLSLLPKERDFYLMLQKHAANIVVAARALAEMLRNYESVRAKAAHIAEIELCTRGMDFSHHETRARAIVGDDVGQGEFKVSVA